MCTMPDTPKNEKIIQLVLVQTYPTVDLQIRTLNYEIWKRGTSLPEP
jgi:hypothetical protein